MALGYSNMIPFNSLSSAKAHNTQEVLAVIARAKRGLTIRKQPSFVPGPRIFYCYSLLVSAGQYVCINDLHN